MAWKSLLTREYTPSVGRRNPRIRRPQATGTGEILRGTSVPLRALSIQILQSALLTVRKYKDIGPENARGPQTTKLSASATLAK